jgi:hypothetical protein
MAFRKVLDLELRRKTEVSFGQWKILTMLSRQADYYSSEFSIKF